MVVLNYTGEEINAKIVYYGPGLSGKTTNLEYLYGQMPADSKGQMVSMKTRTDRTLFFDFFPLELGEINGYRTRFLLYTVPGQVYYNATRKLVLKGADAVVFVADSAPDKLQENIESLRNLEDNLNEHGLSLDNIPWIVQYNKRDLPNCMPVSELHQHLNLMNVPAFEAIAMTGVGVYDTFKEVAGMLYSELKERLESGEVIATQGPGGEEASPVVGGERREDVSTTIESALREVGIAERATPGAAAPNQPPLPEHPVPVAPQPESPLPAPPVPIPEPVASKGEQPSPIPLPRPNQAPQPLGESHANPRDAKQDATRAPLDTSRVPQSVTPAPVGPDPAPKAPRVPIPEPVASKGEQPSPMQSPQPTRASQPLGQSDHSPRDASQPLGQADHSSRPFGQSVDTPRGAPQDALRPGDGLKFGAPEEETSPDVGRLVELDEPPENGGNESDSADFITDPMQRNAPDRSPEIVPEEGPVVTERKAEPVEQELVVPVVVSRSQVRKTIPLKLRLEIQVVDD